MKTTKTMYAYYTFHAWICVYTCACMQYGVHQCVSVNMSMRVNVCAYECIICKVHFFLKECFQGSLTLTLITFYFWRALVLSCFCVSFIKLLRSAFPASWYCLSLKPRSKHSTAPQPFSSSHQCPPAPLPAVMLQFPRLCVLLSTSSLQMFPLIMLAKFLLISCTLCYYWNFRIFCCFLYVLV